jgi:DNA repair exonuclease SbcCD ATPase subunit
VLQKYKTKQLSSLAPTIAGIMKNYLSYLTEGKYDLVELDEHYNIFVYRNNIRQPFHLFSGGEKKLISLVQRLAISQILISKTSKKKFEFLAFDEALGMLDEDRQTNIVETLEKLTSKFSQIFLISHSSTIHDMFKYRLMVKQNADLSSTIYWENEWNEEAIKEKVIL